MLTGDQIRRAREKAGMTQADLARHVGVSLRAVGNWERGETSPRGKAHLLQDLLFPQGDTVDQSLRQSSDAELLAEIARRLEKAQRRPRPTDLAVVGGGIDALQDATEPDDETEDYELAASYGDEGIGPDELPEST